LKNILLIFNKIKLHILRKKWFVFDDKTTNLLKYAVFEINDLRCEGGIFRRKSGGDSNRCAESGSGIKETSNVDVGLSYYGSPTNAGFV